MIDTGAGICLSSPPWEEALLYFHVERAEQPHQQVVLEVMDPSFPRKKSTK